MYYLIANLKKNVRKSENEQEKQGLDPYEKVRKSSVHSRKNKEKRYNEDEQRLGRNHKGIPKLSSIHIFRMLMNDINGLFLQRHSLLNISKAPDTLLPMLLHLPSTLKD